MSSNSQQVTQQSSLPKLNGLQFDPQSKLVNLFRGSASFPIEILDLPSRNGLSYSLNLLYQSDIGHTKVDQWSIDEANDVATEEIAGVGWALPYERIIIAPKFNGTFDDNQYFWIMSGQLMPLQPIKRSWTRGVLESSYTTDLENSTVNTNLQEGFLDQQLVVSTGSAITALSATCWEISDSDNEIVYTLVQDGSSNINIMSGRTSDTTTHTGSAGISFELYNYQYWQITYYPSFEKWQIIKNDGNIYTFGGSGQEIDTGVSPHVQQKGVKWGNWIGPSSETAGQEQYTKAWNLAKVENQLGNYYHLNYTVEEQIVGTSGGENYTKNCQVSKVKNDLGWSIEYKYNPAVYDNSSLEAPKEYLDPHSDPATIPGSSQTAYQSEYQTKYLSEIIIYNAADEIEKYIKFDYVNFGTESEPVYVWSPNQLGASPSDQEKLAFGATHDRYLKSITEYAGKSYSYQENVKDRYKSPGISFNYNFDKNDTSKPKGLLTEVINPTGGKTTLEYELLKTGSTPSQDSRSLTINSPINSLEEDASAICSCEETSPRSQSASIPRTWSGPGYTVNCWYNAEDKILRLNVYTWVGRWAKAFSDWQVYEYPVDLDRLQVVTAQDTFLLVLSSNVTTQNTFVYKYNRKKFQKASWVCSNQNTPDIYQGNQISAAKGNNFFIVVNNNSNLVNRYNWNALSQAWNSTVTEVIPAQETCYSVTSENYYVLYFYNRRTQQGKFKFFSKDIFGDWTIQKTLDANISIPALNGFSYFQMAAGSSFVSIAVVTGYTLDKRGLGFDAFDYEINILSWDENYDLQHTTMEEIQDISNGSFNNIPSSVIKDTGIGPTPIANTAIGSGPNYIYYNGADWKCQSLGVNDEGFKNRNQQYYWYAYDEQGVIKTENTDSGITSMVGNIDPSNPSSGWLTQTLLDTPGNIIDRYNKDYPTNAGQFLTIGDQVYAKPLGSGNWGDLTGQNFLNIQTALNAGENVDTRTVINTGNYLLFQILDENQNPKDVGIVYFKNGTYVTQEGSENVKVDRLTGQQMFNLFQPDHTYVNNINGKFAQTFDGVVTYPVAAKSIDSASFITLNHYTAERFKGQVAGWTVKLITTDSGYDKSYGYYKYDQTRAAADGYKGTILRFDKVTEYQGTATLPQPGTAPNGYTVSYFYNGNPDSISSGESANSNYSILDGTLYCKEAYKTRPTGSDQLVSSSKMNYEVKTEIKLNPDDMGTNYSIYGGIVQLQSAVSTKDGVETTASNTYSASSGNITSTQTSYYDSTGQEVTVNKTTQYAYQQADYIGLWYQNNLSLVAKSTTSNTRGSTTALVSKQVQTYKLWDVSTDPDAPSLWGTWKNYVAYNEAPDSFTWWSGPSEPDPDTNGWIKTNDVLSRNEQGAVVTYTDIEGIPTTALYDDSNTFSLATFANAKLEDGISYTSFESYQANPWTQDTGTGALITTDAFLGKQCYELSATSTTASAVSHAVDVENADQYYGFSFWYKTLPSADSGNVITLTVSTTTGTSTSQTTTLDLTNGEWTPFQWSVNLANLWTAVPAGPIDIKLEIKLEAPSATGTEYLRVDQIIFTPTLSPYDGTVYNLDKLRALGNIAADGNSGKVLFNNVFNADYSAVGPYNQTTTLDSSYSIRQDPSYDPDAMSFPQTNPNMSMAVSGRDQGFYDQFMSDESLDHYTAVEGSVANWSITNNSLEINDSTNTGRQLLEINNYDTGTSNNLSVGVTVLPTFTTNEANPQQSMCLGVTNSGNTTRFYVEWTGTGTTDQWQLVKWDDTGSSYSVVATNTTVNWQPNWLLTVVEDRLFFTANGILIFNYQDTDLAGSTYTALIGTDNTTTQGLIQFQNLTVLGDIQMEMGYSDGIGRPLQSLAVESSDSVIMTPSVYDAKGKSSISLLPSRIEKGVNGVTNPFAYDNSFIDNGYRTSTSSIWDGYPITGTITNYHTDGYPFSRVINEASPLGRPIKSSMPGEDFAIRDSNNPNTHITTYTYESVTTDPGFWYALPTDPSSHYFMTTITDPDGKKTVQYMTSNENLVGTINYDASGENPIKSSQVHDIRGQVIGIIPPNYYQENTPNQTTFFNPGPTPTPAYASSFKYDFWGRQIETYYPDSGSSKMVYDNAGRPRFTQDANGAASNNTFNYIKYDILGRDIEEGVYTASTAWSQATIANANDSSWPSTNNTASNTTLYDIDNTTGANTTSLMYVGRQWKNTTYNDSTDTADITNTYTYRTTGEILTNTQQAAFTSGSPGMGAYTTTNVYTVNGRLVSTSDATTDVITTYFVNLLGQTTEVQATHDPSGTPKTVKTTYTYDQRGNIATMDLFDPTNTSLTTKTYSYLPNNWVAGMSDSFVDQDLSYTTNNCSGSGYYNGSLSHNTVTYPGVTTPTPPPSDYCYTVDQLNRVITANNNGGTDYSWTFDNNSNFVTHTIDSGTAVTRDYTTANNTNRLTNITSDPSFLREFIYDANGNLVLMKDGVTPTPNTLTEITYNNWNDKARSIEKPQTNIESVFDYDPDDLRYRKRIYDTTSGSTLTETILSPGGLEIRFNASGTATQTLANISVPGVGLVYRLENDTFYWIMPDHLGSTRMIVDENGTVQDLYNYEV
ncbi:MAG: hypothetical protein CMM87_06190, partial [Rickettsiales bacterium]|nr:hypothetical protein [Rickettsiales bacterium]